MKKNALFQLPFICLAAFLLIQSATAGSAVVWDGGRNVGTSYGHPLEIAKQRALESARARGWVNVRIIGASARPGYGAVVVARHPNGRGSLIAVALGSPSATAANAAAIKACLEAGGTNPTVKSRFRDTSNTQLTAR